MFGNSKDKYKYNALVIEKHFLTKTEVEDVEAFTKEKFGVRIIRRDFNYCDQVGEYLYDIDIGFSTDSLITYGESAAEKDFSEFMFDAANARERAKAKEEELEKLRNECRDLKAKLAKKDKT